MNGAEAKEQQNVDEKALAFFGVITASVTHELNNVLAIIEQVNGLLEDLVAGAQDGRTIAPEKIANIQERITKQVNRGVGIIKRLNTFAHSADEPIRSCDLSALLADLVALCERFAALRKQKLEFHAPGKAVTIRNNPYNIELAAYLSLRLAMEAVPAEGQITLFLKEHEAGAQIVISGSPVSDLKDSDGKQADLAAVVRGLGGSFTKINTEREIRFELKVPQISSEEQ